MRHLRLTLVLVLAFGGLAACDRAPEAPPVAPAPAAEPLPAPAVVQVAPAAAPTQVAVPPAMPEARSRPAAPAPRPAALPAGFVRVAGGMVIAADGRQQAVAGYAIARDPVTVDALRAWADAEGGRRLPGLGDAAGAVAKDLDWFAAEAYASWLSARHQRRYRLPTELEWRRAAQSGRIHTQAQRGPAEPPLWEWTADCWSEDTGDGACASRVLVGGDNAEAGGWGRAPMGARRPAASFRLVLEAR